MAVIGVSITKRAFWEGDPEEFSNVYHYTDPALVFDSISDTDAASLANIIADAERPIHSRDVDFIRARVWGPTDGTQEENDTIAVVDLTGTGEGPTDDHMCLEDCVLVRTLSRRESVRGRPVWLRKWYRTMKAPGLVDGQFTDGVHARSEQMNVDTITAVQNVMEEISNVNLIELTSFPDTLILSSPSGRRIKEQGEREYEVYPYLQTHDVKY